MQFPRGLHLLDGQRRTLRAFHLELAHTALQNDARSVLWCDGDHGFNPYGFAEVNLTRGLQADDGASRLLIKRAMTPFQWDSILRQQLLEKLATTPTSLVIVAPFHRLFSTDELKDWEQEMHVDAALASLQEIAKHVPVVLSVDMKRWSQTHPVLATKTREAAKHWFVENNGGWRVQSGETVIEKRAWRSLDDYVEKVIA